MPFAFNPDDRPARLFRFVERGTLPSRNLIAIYVEKDNLLIIDREHYEKMTSVEQKQLLRTHSASTLVDNPLPDDDLEKAA
jgi:hypothetical protein